MRKTTFLDFYKLSVLACKFFIVLSSLAIIFLTCIQVVFRYVFRNPLLGPEELSIMVVLWLLFAGAAYATSRGFTVSGGIPLKKESSRRLMEVIFSFLALLVILAFTYLVINHAIQQIQQHIVSIALRIPIIYTIAGVLCGLLLMTGYTIFELVTRIKTVRQLKQKENK